MARNINRLPLYGLEELSRPQVNVVKEFLWMCTLDGLEYCHTGSRLVEKATWDDTDFAVLVPDLGKYTTKLMSEGWGVGGSEVKTRLSTSLKKNNINLILTEDKEYFDKWCEASNIVSTYQTTYKENRIKIFGYVYKENGHTDVTQFQEALKDEDPYIPF